MQFAGEETGSEELRDNPVSHSKSMVESKHLVKPGALSHIMLFLFQMKKKGMGHHGSRHLPQHQQRLKSSAQGAQDPGHLPKAVGQDIQVFGQTNQLHLQPSGAE